LQLMEVGLAGISEPGNSLLQIEGAGRIDITGCQITAWQRDAPPRGLQLVDAISLLAPLAPALQPDSVELFAPLSAELADRFATFDPDMRKQFSIQVERVLRSRPQDLTADEEQALRGLAIDVGAGEAVRIAPSLVRLRMAILQALPAPALCLNDAGANTLLADNHIHGSLSLYGEASDEESHLELLKAVAASRITLGGQTELRLRNNHLREIRLGERMLKRMEALLRTGGVLEESFRSLVADANVLTGRESELAARYLALSHNTLLPWRDVGGVLASQGKYLGNFADNDFRLFVFGHQAEAFGNGALNIVG
nr:hypothetical protein [Pseudomonas sp.]